jgi:hypothetical protein
LTAQFGVPLSQARGDFHQVKSGHRDLADKAIQSPLQLLQLHFDIAGLDGMADAVANVIVQNQPRHPIQRSLDGGNLQQHIWTGLILLDHGADPTHMPFDASQAVGQLAPRLGIMMVRLGPPRQRRLFQRQLPLLLPIGF